MQPKKGRPEKGKKAGVEQFQREKVPHGFKNQFYAWCAGEPYWCEAHEHNKYEKGTKICLTWATDGALTCPRCKPFRETTSVAYVPLYREVDTGPAFVICHYSVADCLAELKYGDYVLVGRAAEDASIFVKRAEERKRFTSSLPERQAPANIFPTLFNLWQYPQYEAWLLAQDNRQKAAANGTTLPAPIAQRLSVPVPTTEVEALAIDAHRNDPVFGGTVDAVTERLQRRVKEAEKNGKHHAKREGE